MNTNLLKLIDELLTYLKQGPIIRDNMHILGWRRVTNMHPQDIVKLVELLRSENYPGTLDLIANRSYWDGVAQGPSLEKSGRVTRMGNNTIKFNQQRVSDLIFVVENYVRKLKTPRNAYMKLLREIRSNKNGWNNGAVNQAEVEAAEEAFNEMIKDNEFQALLNTEDPNNRGLKSGEAVQVLSRIMMAYKIHELSRADAEDHLKGWTFRAPQGRKRSYPPKSKRDKAQEAVEKMQTGSIDMNTIPNWGTVRAHSQKLIAGEKYFEALGWTSIRMFESGILCAGGRFATVRST